MPTEEEARLLWERETLPTEGRIRTVEEELRYFNEEAVVVDLSESTHVQDNEIVPSFHLQLNTQEIELRELRDRQPQEILENDFSLPFYQALNSLRDNLRSLLYEVRRLQTAKMAYEKTDQKNKKILLSLVGQHFQSSQLRYIRDSDRQEIQGTYTYEAYAAQLREYLRRKDKFINDKVTFAPIQARYNQQCAMIRQKPRNMKEINCQVIIGTVSKWKNVWGVSIHHGVSNDWVKIRIGLCDIAMCESAEETRYDYEAEILLAPFLFTIKLNSDGTFVCQSGNGNTQGLSRENNPGSVDYDMHPHQLSDTPCFGTFGQSFNDMAHTGDMISLISGIIAFYSQYNSQDSAGVGARRYHPANICGITDVESYKDSLTRSMMYTSQVLDETKLTDAIAAYTAYHTENKYHAAPDLNDRYICYSCEETDVTDDYWSTCDGDRVCEGCWNDHYCSNCERHDEDCICEPED